MASLTSLAAAMFGVSRAALTLRSRGFAAACGSCLVAPPSGAADDGHPERLVRSYARTAILPWSTCLSRSLALCRALRRRRLPAVMRLGAARDGPGLKAHAWVEMHGRVLNDSTTIAAVFPPLAAPDRPPP